MGLSAIFINESIKRPIRTFKTILFHKWAIQERLTDTALIKVLEEVVSGLVEANLGGHVYKKRIRLPGRGKSGGARTLLVYKDLDKAFFVYGYTKNERENINESELKSLKKLAADLLGYTNIQLEEAVAMGELIEIS